MEAGDRSRMLKMLAESRDALCSAAANVTEDQARLRPAPDKWSVLDCVEHVAITEHFMFSTVATQSTPAPPTGDRSREEFFLRAIPNRVNKIAAPDRAHPKGRFATLAAALDQFNQNRARTIDYVQHCDKDLRAHTVPHVLFGQITVQEILIIIALHPTRHAAQIHEVRESLGLHSR